MKRFPSIWLRGSLDSIFEHSLYCEDGREQIKWNSKQEIINPDTISYKNMTSGHVGRYGKEWNKAMKVAFVAGEDLSKLFDARDFR